jgi:pimeloyl-ACP methyl ester carboxylesterase
MTAQQLALRHPERVEKLILVGTYARPDAKRRLLLEKWREMAQHELGPGVMVRERLLWTLRDETLEQSDLVDAMASSFPGGGLPIDSGVFMRQCDACLGHDTADRLREIRQPTLVICGRHDQLTPPKFHRELADEIPNAHLMTLSSGAHLVMAECAQQLNEAVLRFLAEAD